MGRPLRGLLGKLSLGVGELLLLGLVNRESGSNPGAARILGKHRRLTSRLRLELRSRLLLRSGARVEPEVVLDVGGLGGSEPLEGGHGGHSGHVVRPSQGWPRTRSGVKPGKNKFVTDQSRILSLSVSFQRGGMHLTFVKVK